MIIALLVPEMLAATFQQQVASPSRSGFKRAKKLRDAYLRRQEQMNVIGHNHKGVHLIMPQPGAKFDRGEHQLSDSWLSEKGGAEAGLIKQPVHRDEGFTRSQIRR